MTNQWRYLQKLINPQTQTALVVTVNDDGTSTCTTATGVTIQLIGDTVAAGDMCLHDKGYIIGRASLLSSKSVFLPDLDYGYVIYASDDSQDWGALDDTISCIDQLDFGAIV